MTAPAQQPLQTCKGRAQALLRGPRLVLDHLIQTPPLRDCFHPFRCKSGDAFSAVAFIHSFGCRGPEERDWHALFASAGAIRPEDLSVLVAYIACPDHVEEVVFGSPGILDYVCRLWDEWLVIEATRMTVESAEAEASRWRVTKSAEDLVWQTDGRNGRRTSQYLLGQSVDVVGMNIVKEVTRRVVKQVLERVSLGGQERFMELLARRGKTYVDTAVGRAKTVLFESVFEVIGDRNCHAD